MVRRVAASAPTGQMAILPGESVGREERFMPQGTVKAFNPGRGDGVLIDDSLVERTFARDAFTASGLRELRIGQRVRFELEGDEDEPRVIQLNIVSL
jgi:cold shock CspA family protein